MKYTRDFELGFWPGEPGHGYPAPRMPKKPLSDARTPRQKDARSVVFGSCSFQFSCRIARVRVGVQNKNCSLRNSGLGRHQKQRIVLQKESSMDNRENGTGVKRYPDAMSGGN
ncbi:predicted protein [Histoplasma capsulatum G186AR]|uniref:Uncharacterized protein n=1 Tax=Ajellomyces capsulatus (strain G186AR / H82 / ATCC MYA-2454 / RMSCC 2432) TaxID=447093 RepID=C0NHE4_AJECG|nr:uncharacterized protein HCBG_02766 [Histoplasma capsulatum G186AR]EEH09229.1 predicted protein [Histoplasma capsulatum G186AR]